MRYCFKQIADYNSVGSVKNHAKMIKKFFGLNYYEDSISLWVSEMDFRMAPEIQEAIIKRVQKGVLGYTGVTEEYYESVIDWLEYKHSVEVKKEWILPSPGTLHALKNVIRTFTDEGDHIIIQEPVYGQFRMQVEGTKRVVVNNELFLDEEGYSIDFEGFEELTKKDEVKMFILCNPHNPVGNVWTQAEIKRLLDICNENNVIVFADEVHAEIIREGVEFHSTAKHSYNNLITAFGLGKAFNITGMHITNLIIQDKKLRKRFTKYTGMLGVSPITLEVVIAAYNEARTWLEEVNQVIDSNMAFIDSFLKDNMPQVKFRIPKGSYLVWLDFSAYNIGIKELTERMADGKILMESGLAFGESGEGFIRMMAATPTSRLEEALKRIQKVLESLD